MHSKCDLYSPTGEVTNRGVGSSPRGMRLLAMSTAVHTWFGLQTVAIAAPAPSWCLRIRSRAPFSPRGYGLSAPPIYGTVPQPGMRSSFAEAWTWASWRAPHMRGRCRFHDWACYWPRFHARLPVAMESYVISASVFKIKLNTFWILWYRKVLLDNVNK